MQAAEGFISEGRGIYNMKTKMIPKRFLLVVVHELHLRPARMIEVDGLGINGKRAALLQP